MSVKWCFTKKTGSDKNLSLKSVIWPACPGFFGHRSEDDAETHGVQLWTFICGEELIHIVIDEEVR